jgi:hypothetical protein
MEPISETKRVILIKIELLTSLFNVVHFWGRGWNIGITWFAISFLIIEIGVHVVEHWVVLLNVKVPLVILQWSHNASKWLVQGVTMGWNRSLVHRVASERTVYSSKHILYWSLSLFRNCKLGVQLLDGSLLIDAINRYTRYRPILQFLREVECWHEHRIFGHWKLFTVKSSSVGPSKGWPVESLSKNPVALRSSTRLLGLNLPLILAALARELAQHCLVIWELVDVWALHVLVFYVFVVGLELCLDPSHFCSNFKLLLCMELSF